MGPFLLNTDLRRRNWEGHPGWGSGAGSGPECREGSELTELAQPGFSIV